MKPRAAKSTLTHADNRPRIVACRRIPSSLAGSPSIPTQPTVDVGAASEDDAFREGPDPVPKGGAGQ